MEELSRQNTLSARLAGLQEEVDQALKKRLVAAGPVRLLGASKSQPPSLVEEAIRLGLMDYGENRVQEAQAKWGPLKETHPGVRLHLIGPLQSNKAREAVALFNVIQTIDRVKIADAVGEEARKQNKAPTTLIQVNIGEEPQKGGVAPRELQALVRHCREAAGLNLVGLMGIPPLGENPAPYFALLKKLADEFALSELSMGMSHDFALAVRFGATYVRIGTRLFGAREQKLRPAAAAP